MAHSNKPSVSNVGPGWLKLVQPLWLYCESNEIEVVQVKEKFGSLRFYTKHSTPALANLINAAEEKSEHTCEWCGAEGKCGGYGWIKTLCDPCRVKWDAGERWWDKRKL
jgi:hypothetical protein